MSRATLVLTQGSVEIKPSNSDIERFWDKVDKRGDDDCWEWMGGKSRGGYGRFWFIDDTIMPHRFSWFLANGKIPQHQPFICHTCDNPSCVNPAHLFAGDSDDNILDMMIKERGARGSHNGAAKLNESQVMEIIGYLASKKRTHKSIAAQFGVHRSTIGLIYRNRKWQHLPRSYSHI